VLELRSFAKRFCVFSIFVQLF
jgi:hypothetical protein